MDRGFASHQIIKALSESLDQHFVLRVKNNISPEMLENGKCQLGKDKREIEVRVVAFCGPESQTELQLATDLPREG